MQHSQTKLFLRCFVAVILLLLAYFISTRVLVEKPSTSHTGLGLSNSEYSIKVYYFPSRKKTAEAIADYFKHEKYRISIESALLEEELLAKRFSPYYLFFNNAETAQAMKIKTILQHVIGYPINAYRRSTPLASPSMIVVLTDKSSP